MNGEVTIRRLVVECGLTASLWELRTINFHDVLTKLASDDDASPECGVKSLY